MTINRDSYPHPVVLYKAVVLYHCPDCPSCLGHLNSIGWATLAAWAKSRNRAIGSTPLHLFLVSSWNCLVRFSHATVVFQITAPFLHVVALAVLTFLSWFIASNALELESKGKSIQFQCGNICDPTDHIHWMPYK